MGFVDIHQADTITVAGLDAYYSTHFIDRYAYARPNIANHIFDAKIRGFKNEVHHRYRRSRTHRKKTHQSIE
jgi:hypothetical protein